ncbi:MAG: GGDEF domain-containing protein [Oleiphilaceae bacterium]|jgi:GGDEF domain-containing protein
MKIELNHLNKSALSALLFICVYHVFSLLMQGSFLVGLTFLCAAIFTARSLINEQKKPKKTQYLYVLLSSWLTLFLMFFTVNVQTSISGLWFCILILCTSILLRPDNSFRLNTIALVIFWVFAFLESSKTFFFIENALALTVILLLSGLIQTFIYQLEAKLSIAKDTDSLTGCIMPTKFKIELEKVVQLHDRYETPFSLICVNYQSHFNSEEDLQTWLKELSHLYQSRLRKTDIICRFETQKFMILLPSTNNNNAQAVSQDLNNCTSVYEFSYKNTSSKSIKSPTLVFSSETFRKNENIDDWFINIQSQ